MDYETRKLSDQIVFIQWHRNPTSPDIERAFLEDLRTYLDTASQPICFFSDLRQGHITNFYTLRKLGTMTGHPNWLGSVAYGQRLATDLYVNTFERLSVQQKGDQMVYKLQDALNSLEALQPGITVGIDWSFLNEDQESM